MFIWFLIIVSVNSNGTVNATLQFPSSYQFNSEAACERNGKQKSDEYQLEMGTKNSKLFWICKPVDIKDIANVLPSKS
jgi:hypothetical protein